MKDDNKTKKQLIDELAELRLQNAALKESESADKYRNLVENIRDVIYELDSQGVVLYISPTVRDLLGFESTEIIGKNFTELAYKDDLNPQMEWFTGLRQGIEKPFEYRLLRKSGDIRWAQTKTRPIMEEGLFKGARGILIDVTEQRLAEETLRVLISRQEAILAAVPEIIMEVDNNKVYTWANSAGVEFFGEDVIGKEADFYFECEQETYDTVAPLFNGAEDIIYLESWQRRKDGEKRLLAWWCRVLKDESGQVTGALSSARDITQHKRAEEALRESEEKFRTLFDRASDGILIADTATKKFLQGNTAICSMLGYTREEIESLTIYDIHPPKDVSRVLDEFEKLIKGEKVIAEDLPVLRKDGSIFYADIGTGPITIGGITYLIGFFRDITNRKRAEEALKKSKTLLDKTFASMEEAIFIVDSNTRRIIACNHATEVIFGFGEKDLIGCSTDILHVDKLSYDLFGQELFPALDANGVFHSEFQMRRKDGSIFPTENTVTEILDDSGHRISVVSVVRDITERKQAEKELKESELRFMNVLHSSKDAILLIDGEKFIDCNEATARMLGYHTRDEFLKSHPSELSPLTQPDGRGSLEKADEMMRTAYERGFHHFEWEHRKANGEDFPVEVSLTSIVLHGKNVLHCVWQDITEKKQAANQLQDTLASLRKVLGATVQAIAITVETRDPYTAGHQRRVADLARAIATEMNLPADQIDGIRMAATIHDLGKISVPAEILSKPTKLTKVEFSLIQTHSQSGYDILKHIDFPWPIARMILEHHERMDGSGYPNGLTGDNILMEARILSVADVVESMASHRPYRPALGIEAAIKEIEQHKGIFYDAAAADACLRLFRGKGYKL